MRREMADAALAARGWRLGCVYSSVPSPSWCRATKLVALTRNEPKPPLLPGVWNLRDWSGTACVWEGEELELALPEYAVRWKYLEVEVWNENAPAPDTLIGHVRQGMRST